MKPGSELDALIATKVMGWHVASLIPDAPAYQDCLWQWPDGRETGYWLTEHASQECPGFSPSTDIAAAFEVVQHVMATYKSKISIETYDGKIWSIKPCDTSSSSLPHAICLAALKACNAS